MWWDLKGEWTESLELTIPFQIINSLLQHPPQKQPPLLLLCLRLLHSSLEWIQRNILLHLGFSCLSVGPCKIDGIKLPFLLKLNFASVEWETIRKFSLQRCFIPPPAPPISNQQLSIHSSAATGASGPFSLPRKNSLKLAKSSPHPQKGN